MLTIAGGIILAVVGFIVIGLLCNLVITIAIGTFEAGVKVLDWFDWFGNLPTTVACCTWLGNAIGRTIRKLDHAING